MIFFSSHILYIYFTDNISSLSGTDFTDSETDEGNTGEAGKAAMLAKLTAGLSLYCLVSKKGLTEDNHINIGLGLFYRTNFLT